MLHTKEHDELMTQFEKEFKGYGRMDKEAKADWTRGIIYQDGHVNNLFKVYRHGYAFGRCVERLES